MSSLLAIGSQAPDFCLLDQSEKEVCLKDFRGGWLVLYFYPKDDTPGCTIEARSFSKDNPSFEKIGAKVVGISADDCGSHKKFSTKYDLTITLLSDPKKTVLKAYGVWAKKRMLGHEFMGIIRTTYLIDPEGRIAYVWEKVKPKEHAWEVKQKLSELRR